MYSLAAVLSAPLTATEVADVVLSDGVAATGASAGMVAWMEPDRLHLRLVGSMGYPPEAVQRWERIAANAPLPVGTAIQSLAPVFIESPAALFEQYPAARTPASPISGAWAVIPLVLNGDALGAITFGFDASRSFFEADRSFVVTLAHLCVQALERARLYESARAAQVAAEASRSRFAFLAEASAVLAGTLNERAVFDALVGLAIPRLADWMTLWVSSADGQLLAPVLAHVDAELEEPLRALQNSFYADRGPDAGALSVLRSGKSIFYPSIPEAMLESALGAEVSARFRKVGMNGALSVALMARGKILGVLTLASARADRVFTPDDLTLAEDLGRRVALAIDQARTHQREQVARQRAEQAADLTLRLQGVTAALSEAATPLQVAQAVLAQAVEALGAIDGAVWELRKGDDALEVVHSVNYSPAAVQAFRRVPLQAAIPIADAARTRTPIWLASRADYQARYPEAKALTEDPPRDYRVGCLPLVAGGGVIGAVTLTFAGGQPFGAEDRDFLTALAFHCAHALERSRLFREAEEAVAVRDEFLSIASHELKTPLAALKLHIELALMTENPTLAEKGIAKLRKADRQIGRLNDLIEEMLDLSRIRTGKLRLVLESLDLVQIAHAVVDDFKAAALSAGTAIHFEADPEINGQWDRIRLEQILTNLLSNGLKYGKGNPVRLAIHVRGEEVEITTTDEGIGIHPRDLERIFLPFQRAASVRHLGGLGLGLYICRQVVEAMGGKISVESKENRGSCFRIVLPRQSPSRR